MKELLIPVQKFEQSEHEYRIGPAPTLNSIHQDDALPLDQLRDDLSALQVHGRVIPDAPSADILIRRNGHFAHPEQYQLTITPQGVEIVSSTAAGAYYAIQTLREILRIHGRTLPCCRVQDKPLFARRAVYHDCSRGKVPKVSTIKQLIERLSHWKINELQLYIENVFTFKKHPDIGKGYSPFTPEDMLELQDHCKRHHMRFVPSLTSFGHFEKILMLPAYQGLGELPGFRNLPGGMTLNPGNPASIRLLADLYGEFLPLFEAEDFNACGDEPWELGRGRSKGRAEKIGVGRVYWDFMMKVRQLCLKHGKRMNIWADIVLKHPEIIPDIPKDVVMLNWAYFPRAERIPRTHEITDAGLPLVCCPGTNAWLSHGSRLQTALDNVSTFARTAIENGAEGFMNTDWGDCGHRNTLGVSLCSFAHGAAHAWNSPAVDDAGHVDRFAFHVFGERDGRLAKAMRCLGAPQSDNWSYYALMQSLLEPKSFVRGVANLEGGASPRATKLTEVELQEHLRELSTLKWPKPHKALPLFETIALEEFALATEMEQLAYERLLMVRSLTNMERLASKQLRRHAEHIDAVAQTFSHLWKSRNRPSRLSDNMARFEGIRREAQTLAEQA